MAKLKESKHSIPNVYRLLAICIDNYQICTILFVILSYIMIIKSIKYIRQLN